jgi:hypothetical protein
LCEKSDQVGGTGSTSAGTLWIPGNHQSQAAGFVDSAEQADIYLNALIGATTNRDLRNAYLQTGPVAIDYLCARSAVQFLPCGAHPDYRSNMRVRGCRTRHRARAIRRQTARQIFGALRRSRSSCCSAA